MTPPRRSSDTIAVAVTFAILTGLVYAGANLLRQALLHRIIWVSTDVVWMSPVAFLVFFVALALLLVLGSLLARRPVPLHVAIGCFGFLATFSLALPFRQIALLASFILALGFGVMLGRAARSNEALWLRRFRRASIALLSCVAATAVGFRAARMLLEHNAITALPSPPRGTPNILLIILDTVRRENLSLYGYRRPTTPRLQQLAQAGTVFDSAFVAAPWTLPSHASIFTGFPAGALGTDFDRPLRGTPATLAEVLSAHGYLTGGFVANLLYTSRAGGLSRGFTHYDDYVPSPNLVLLHSSLGRSHLFAGLRAAWPSVGATMKVLRNFNLRSGGLVAADDLRRADDVADGFLTWQRGIGPRPFFAFLNLFDAHGAHRAPAMWQTKFSDAPTRIDLYDGAIAYLDHEVGRIVDSLERRGVLDHTIVIVTSDHGEQFGEHGLISHGNSLYLPLLEVPLVIRYPASVPAGRRVGALVSLRDLAATMLDLAGVDPALPGRSLAVLWHGPSAATSPIAAEVTKGNDVPPNAPNYRGPMRGLIVDHWHYIRNGSGSEELYAWRSDTAETTNLIATAEAQAALPILRRQLDSALSVRASGARP